MPRVTGVTRCSMKLGKTRKAPLLLSSFCGSVPVQQLEVPSFVVLGVGELDRDRALPERPDPCEVGVPIAAAAVGARSLVIGGANSPEARRAERRRAGYSRRMLFRPFARVQRRTSTCATVQNERRCRVASERLPSHSLASADWRRTPNAQTPPGCGTPRCRVPSEPAAQFFFGGSSARSGAGSAGGSAHVQRRSRRRTLTRSTFCPIG